MSHARSRPGTDTQSTRVLTRMYDIETIGDSEEHIIEMGGVGKHTHTSGASTGDSEPAEWAQSSADQNREPDPYIWKTTEIVIEKS